MGPAIKMDLSIGIISWNTKEPLKRLLISIYEFCQETSFEIIVVDNNSSDTSVDMLRKDFPQVKLIANKDNKGFSRAVNQAIKMSSSEFVFVCNSDIFLKENIFLKMLEFMQLNPKVAILGPKIINEAGNIEMSLNMSCSGLMRCILDNLFFYSYFRTKIFEKYIMAALPAEIREKAYVLRPVAWLSGAAFLLRKSATLGVGLMDERFFLYCEDEDFCCRMKRSGWQVCYFPESLIVHSRGKSTEKVECNLVLESTKSKVHFYRKRYKQFIAIVKLLLFYRLALELLLLSLGFLFSRKDKMKKKIRDYFNTLRLVCSL